MSDYDYRELRIYFRKDTAQTIKHLAKNEGLSEQEFVKKCVLNQLSSLIEPTVEEELVETV